MAKLTNFYLNSENEENLPRLSKYFKYKNMLERENKTWVINLALKELYEKMESEILDFESKNTKKWFSVFLFNIFPGFSHFKNKEVFFIKS